jgi:hypothetical protein
VITISFVSRVTFGFVVGNLTVFLLARDSYQLNLAIHYIGFGEIVSYSLVLLFKPSTLLEPALLVFLWLPLFGISLSIIRAFNAIIPLFVECNGF